MRLDSVLRCEGLAIERGGRTLATGLTLDLAPGARGLVLGANGSGKSTLAAGLCGLLPLRAARLERPARIGYAPQEPDFPGARRCREYLRELAALGGAGRSAAAQADAALRLFALEEMSRHRISELSRGWRQRLNLARAWLGRPALVILDEPQTALDPDGFAALGRALILADQAVLLVAPPGAGCEALAPPILRLGQETATR